MIWSHMKKEKGALNPIINPHMGQNIDIFLEMAIGGSILYIFEESRVVAHDKMGCQGNMWVTHWRIYQLTQERKLWEFPS